MSITISARRLKRYEAAENVARAFAIGLTTYDQTTYEQAHVIREDWINKWMQLAGANIGSLPVPARWKRNRDKSMGVAE